MRFSKDIRNSSYKINEGFWNEITPVHISSSFYNLEGFIAENCPLGNLEKSILGDIRNKRILHLQCSFGTDTLALAKLGAEVIAVDFSTVAIDKAQELAKDLKIDKHVHFIKANVLDLDKILNEKFDIVYATHGIVIWIGDLDKWARIIANSLNREGFLFLLDDNPLILYTQKAIYDFSRKDVPLTHQAGPRLIKGEPDYADPNYIPSQNALNWFWSLENITSALRNNGLRIREICEYPFNCYPMFPNMSKNTNGYWYLKEKNMNQNLLFSILATHDS